MTNKVIIDTDPGVDDALAILLALSALPEELELLLISVTYGNIDLDNCLRNVVSLFHHIGKEIEWRKSQGRPVGFGTLLKTKPLVALGPDHPLADQMLMADYFHGTDGLGGIHDSHPHLSISNTWRQLFSAAETSNNPEEVAMATELSNNETLFTPSRKSGKDEILRLLSENPPDTITIIAIGPLTNLALAAAEDPETFLRVKEVVVMGGTVAECGNITPVAEFNTFADSLAAARVYALTSPNPHTTMPPTPPAPHGQTEGQHPPPYLATYPPKLSRRLKATMFPLDITNYHLITRGVFRELNDPLMDAKSPLAEWVSAFLNSTFNKVESLQNDVSGDAVGLQLHDPLCVWYCMAAAQSGWEIIEDEDLRIETSGQWTRGMCIVDRRQRRKRDDDDIGERPGDTGNWLSAAAGNRVRRVVASPDLEGFGIYMMKRIFMIPT